MLVKTFGSRHWIMAATGRWDVSQYAIRMQGPANTALVRYADRFEGDLGFFVGPIRFTKFIQALSLSLSLSLSLAHPTATIVCFDPVQPL